MLRGFLTNVTFVHVVSSMIGAGFGAWSLYFLLRPRMPSGQPKPGGGDSSMEIIVPLVFAAVAFLMGLWLGGYVALLMGAIAVSVAFLPRISKRSWTAIGIIIGGVWISYVAIPRDNLRGKPQENQRSAITSSVRNCFAYDDKDLLTGNDFLIEWIGGAPTLQGDKRNHIKDAVTRDFAELAQKAAGAPGLSKINYFRPVIALSYLYDTFFWAEVEPWESFRRRENKSRVDLKWSHLNSIGFHVTNILAHAMNCLLVFVLVRSLSRRFWFAVTAAFLFAVHPIHTESVSWIAGRTDVMGFTFFLLAFWLYVRFRNSGCAGCLVASFASFLIGMFAKEMIAGLPFVLMVYEGLRWLAERRAAKGADLWIPDSQIIAAPSEDPAGEEPDDDKAERKKGKNRARHQPKVAPPVQPRPLVLEVLWRWRWVGVFFLLMIPYFVAKGPSGPPVIEADTWYDRELKGIIPITTRFFSFMSAIFWYFEKSLVPHNLNIYPTVDFVGAGTGLLYALIHLAIVGGAGFIAWKYSRARLFSLGVICFYVSLGPLSCLLPGARLLRFGEDVDFPVSERFLYFPTLFIAIGVAWLLAVGLPMMNRSAGKMVGIAAIALITIYSFVLIQSRQVDWYDDYRLFQSGVRTNPRSVRMANNCGFELMQNWQIKKARRMLTRCTQLVQKVYKGRAPMPVAFQNLGHSFYLQGEFDNAVRFYRQSFAQDPRNAVAANNLGALMGIFGSITMDIKLVRDGLRYYEESVKLAPQYVYAKSSVGFMKRVHATWDHYLFGKNRRPHIVVSFGNSFLFSAKSISESDDPKFLQAMQILDSGLRSMPTDAEMVDIFGLRGEKMKLPPEANQEELPHEVKERMRALFAKCAVGAIKKFEGLMDKYGRDNAALNFMMGETYRVRWRTSGASDDRTRALDHYGIVLARENDHIGATIGSVELLRSVGRSSEAFELAARTTDVLLTESLGWEGPPHEPATGDPRGAIQLAKRIRTELDLAIKSGRVENPDEEKKRWDRFVDDTIDKCLRYQRQFAEKTDGGNDPELWNNLGYFYVLAYDVRKDKKLLSDHALPLFDKALNMDAERKGPALNKIHVLELLGRKAAAQALRLEMMRLHPRDPRFRPPPRPKPANLSPGTLKMPERPTRLGPIGPVRPRNRR